MRDYKESFSGTLDMRSYGSDRGSACGYPIVSWVRATTHLVSKRGRDNPVPTPWPHVTPTNYRAFEWNMSAKPGTYKSEPWRVTTLPCYTHYRYLINVIAPHIPYAYERLGLRLDADVDQNGISRTVYRPSVSNQTIAAATNSALGKLRSGKVDLGQSFGEIYSVANSIHDALSRLAKAMLAFKKRKYREAMRLLGLNSLQGHASNWLAYRFGWAPIINDVNNMTQEISNGLDRYRISVKGVSVATTTPYCADSSWLASGTLTEGCEVGISLKVSDSVLAGINYLGLYNDAGIAWALLPYSFVVDWFVSIGAFLSSLTAGVGMDYEHGYRTLFNRNNYQLEMVRYGESFPLSEKTRALYAINSSAMQRYILPELPYGLVSVRFPMDVNKMSTLMAMLIQSKG